MTEVTIKGKGLIKKIAKTDPKYTTDIPLNGELVCVTDNDGESNPVLVVGDGTSTVNNCPQIGGNNTPPTIPKRLILTYTNDGYWTATGAPISSEYSQVCFETTNSSFSNSTIFSRCHYVRDEGDLTDTYTFSVWTTNQFVDIIVQNDYEDDIWYVNDPLEAESFQEGDIVTIDFYPLPQFPEEPEE